MEKGQGKRTDTLPGDNDYLRRGDVKRLLENVVCLHEELPAQIDLIPAADVRPVRHGRWVVSRTDYSWNSAEFPTHCKCDQCGREVPYQDRDNYCPHCGARMDGDGE